MNYIGSKKRLLPFLEKEIFSRVDKKGLFIDLFAGTGVVAQMFKENGCDVLANDHSYFSYPLLNAKLKFKRQPTPYEEELEKIYELARDYVEKFSEPMGFIEKEYTGERTYFTLENARLIDFIRGYIDVHYPKAIVGNAKRFYFIASLISAADKVANVASIYGAYLKTYKKTALKELQINPIKVTPHVRDDQEIIVRRMDALKCLVSNTREDSTLYLDPPYNARQYGANYHLLDTIALYDQPEIKGKTGLRADYLKSEFCSKKTAKKGLCDILKANKGKNVFLSYNNEGIIGEQGVIECFESNGYEVEQIKFEYQRFKSNNNKQSAKKVIECLYHGVKK